MNKWFTIFFHAYILLGPLCALAVTVDNNLIITGGKDRKVIAWKCHNP
jgi:hypothetical protein